MKKNILFIQIILLISAALSSACFTTSCTKTVTSFGDGESALTITANGVSFEMVYVKGGTFWMGVQSDDPDGQNYDSEAGSDESPVHRVTLSDYWIGQTEVTRALWEAVMGSTDYFKNGNDYPVVYISWNDIQTFLSKLNSITGRTFVLPTEAEWEFAARGGTKSKGYKYSGGDDIDAVAWYWNNIPSQTSGEAGFGTQPVGTKQPNELGIYDMSGNVYEWCSDWYGNYDGSSQTNPQGPSSGFYRVVRGGGWHYDAECCRMSYRDYGFPDPRGYDYGFRLALLP